MNTLVGAWPDFAFATGVKAAYAVDLRNYYTSTRPMRSSPPSRPMGRQPAMPIASNVRATVKWYNSSKGFGFVTPEDGSPDAFLHGSVLNPLGYDNVPEGTTLIVDLAQGQKGPQVSAVRDIDTSTATPGRSPAGGRGGAFGGPRERSGGRGGYDRDSGPTEEVGGTVKWYNAEKGFGFIAPDAGGKDIFIHASAIERSGLTVLPEGAYVRAQVRQGNKGPEAVSIEMD